MASPPRTPRLPSRPRGLARSSSGQPAPAEVGFGGRLPDLRLLPILDALLDARSVTQAAARVGLSVPAASRALGRLRTFLGDPLLLPAGRAMVLTARGEALRGPVRASLAAVAAVWSPPRPFEPASVQRAFVIRTTDAVLATLGGAIDAALGSEAPGIELRFLHSAPDDDAALREGRADFAIGIYRALPPELRRRVLITDHLVCVCRREHPLRGRLDLDAWLAQTHVRVSPRGEAGGMVDDWLAESGLARRVTRTFSSFLAALLAVAESDHLLLVPERLARRAAPLFGLHVAGSPVAVPAYSLSLLWHPRTDADEASRMVRGLIVREAKKLAGQPQALARTRLRRRPRSR